MFFFIGIITNSNSTTIELQTFLLFKDNIIRPKFIYSKSGILILKYQSKSTKVFEVYEVQHQILFNK